MMKKSFITIFILFTCHLRSSTELNVNGVNDGKQNYILPQNYLIYPSSNLFKEFILPFVSTSRNLIKMFFHFQTKNPRLNFENFIPHPFTDSWTRSDDVVFGKILNAQGSKNFLFQFKGDFNFLDPILCVNTKIQISAAGIILEKPGLNLVYFEKELKFENLEPYTLENGEILLFHKKEFVSNNFYDKYFQFYCCVRKSENDFEFVSEGENSCRFFKEVMEASWAVYNLGFFKKLFYKFVFIFQRIFFQYEKYLVFVTKCFEKINKFFEIISNMTCLTEGVDNVEHLECPVSCVLSCPMWWPVSLVLLAAWAHLRYLLFYGFLIPFVKFDILYVPQILYGVYTLVLPHTGLSLLFLEEKEMKFHYDLPQAFETNPKFLPALMGRDYGQLLFNFFVFLFAMPFLNFGSILFAFFLFPNYGEE